MVRLMLVFHDGFPNVFDVMIPDVSWDRASVVGTFVRWRPFSVVVEYRIWSVMMCSEC